MMKMMFGRGGSARATDEKRAASNTRPSIETVRGMSFSQDEVGAEPRDVICLFSVEREKAIKLDLSPIRLLELSTGWYFSTDDDELSPLALSLATPAMRSDCSCNYITRKGA